MLFAKLTNHSNHSAIIKSHQFYTVPITNRPDWPPAHTDGYNLDIRRSSNTNAKTNSTKPTASTRVRRRRTEQMDLWTFMRCRRRRHRRQSVSRQSAPTSTLITLRRPASQRCFGRYIAPGPVPQKGWIYTHGLMHVMSQCGYTCGMVDHARTPARPPIALSLSLVRLGNEWW